ncbi:MAG: hypothetical protein ACT4OJ_16595 [Bacteroidota bacterium]
MSKKTNLTLYKGTAMRKFRLFSAVLSLFLLVPASIIWAQTVSISGHVYEKGTIKNNFNTPQGKISVILPDVMAPGDVITGTVIYDPAGEDEKKKSNNYRDMANYSLSLPDGTPLSTNPASDTPSAKDIRKKTFSLIIASGLSSLQLILKDPAGKAIGEAKIPLVSQSFLMPVEDVFSIQGRGVVVDTSKTKPRTYKPIQFDFTTDKKIYLPGENADLIFKPLVSNEPVSTATFSFYYYSKTGQEQEFLRIKLTPLCTSPRKTVIQIPQNVSGDGDIITEDDRGNFIKSQKVHVMKLEALCPKTSLLKDEETTLNVSVRDIRGVQADYIRLAIENINRSSIRVGNSPCEHIFIDNSCYSGSSPAPGQNLNILKAGSTDKSWDRCQGSSYELQRPVVAMQTGNFTINISLFYSSSVYNDPFRQQLDALKTPEQFNRWVDALKYDLKKLDRSLTNTIPALPEPTDEEYLLMLELRSLLEPYEWKPIIERFHQKIESGDKNLINPLLQDELDKAKAIAYQHARSFNLSNSITEKYFSSTIEAGKVALENAQNSSGNEPVHFEVMESALKYAEHQAAIANDTPAVAAASRLKDDLWKLQRGINKADQLFQLLESIRKNFDDATNKALQNMRSSIKPGFQFENLVGYYDPLDGILTTITGKQQKILNNLSAAQQKGQLYMMHSVNYNSEPVEAVFRLKAVSEAGFRMAATNAVLQYQSLFLQDAGKPQQDKQDNDWYSKFPEPWKLPLKNGVVLWIYEGVKCRDDEQPQNKKSGCFEHSVYDTAQKKWKQTGLYNIVRKINSWKCLDKGTPEDICVMAPMPAEVTDLYLDDKCSTKILQSDTAYAHRCIPKSKK